MLIGLNGKLKAGKDTTFEVISDLYPFAERISFAEKLKQSAANSLGMSRELMDELKTHENIHITIAGTTGLTSLLPSILAGEAAKWSMTMREFLQRYGTEGHREIFGESFWVDMALPADLDHSDRLLVVTDMRFPNEIDRVKELGGICVKVKRDVESKFSSHASEQNVDHLMDYTLDNTKDIDHLYQEVDKMIKWIKTKTQQSQIAHAMWAWEVVNAR